MTTKTWKEQELWAKTIDEKYYATVNRTDASQGLLTIKELITIDKDNQEIGEIVYQEPVYVPRTGVRFSHEDAAEWRDLVAKFIDERNST